MDPRLEEALRRARLGDSRAFETVADHLGPPIVRYLTTLLGGDEHAARDVAQEVFVRAWAALEAVQDATHLRRWCYRVARFKAISWMRRRAPPGRRVDSLDRLRDDGRPIVDPPATPLPAGEGGDLLAALRRALIRLPARYAGPVHLHYVQGCSTREAAELLGLKRQAVKMRLFRARAYLKREIHNDRAGRHRPSSAPRQPDPHERSDP